MTHGSKNTRGTGLDRHAHLFPPNVLEGQAHGRSMGQQTHHDAAPARLRRRCGQPLVVHYRRRARRHPRLVTIMPRVKA
jgi:hypothetical protein